MAHDAARSCDRFCYGKGNQTNEKRNACEVGGNLMNFDANIPIYLQIMDDFKKLIVAGTYVSGMKVKAVRELALDYGVNPNTVQRALSELEREQLLYSERTSGRYITKDEKLIDTLKTDVANRCIDMCIKELQELGFSDAQIIEKIQRRIQDGEHS